MFKGSEIISVVVYILLNIYLRLCFCCRLSTFTPDFFTLDSRLFTRDSRLFTPDSRLLLSTLDNYPRLLTFTLDSRASTFRYTPSLHIKIFANNFATIVIKEIVYYIVIAKSAYFFMHFRIKE